MYIIWGGIIIKSRIIFAGLILFVLISLACVSAADNQTTDNPALESDAVTNEILIDEQTVANFTTLKNDISNAGNELKLERDYTYNYDEDLSYVSRNGISIEKDNFVIDGQGHTLNGVESVRIFIINSENVTLKNINFVNGNARGDGGAVLWHGANGIIQNCNFANHAASQYGGALYFDGNVNIANCNFTNNTATYGGAIDIEGDVGNLTNCNFANNTASTGLGGAIYFFHSGNVTNCKFTNNTASQDGGAIYIYKNIGTVTNCIFTDNRAKFSAAIDMKNGGIVTNSIFSNNNDSYSGKGTISFTKYGKVANCNFTNNCAGYGGAVYFDSKGDVANCNFINHTGFNDGGALYFKGTGNVTNCNFTNNTAPDGAAIYFNSMGNVTNCKFTENTARYGGALYIEDSGTVTNCIFTNNAVTESGGAIYFNENAEVTNCNFSNNSASSYGGAVYFKDHAKITNCNFNYNNASVGSASFFNSDSNSITIFDSLFLNNRADADDFQVIQTENNIEVMFMGRNNLLNALYSNGDISFTNVTYWGANGITNTGSSPTSPSRSNKEAGQNITVSLVVDGVTILNTTNVTDGEGKIVLDKVDGIFTVTAHHDSDSYYTQVKTSKTSTVTSLSAFEWTATAIITPNISIGTVTFSVENESGIVKTIETTLNDGVAEIELTKLSGGEYLITATYNENINYLSSKDNLTYNIPENKSTYSGLTREIGSGGDIKLKYHVYDYDSGDTIEITVDNSVIDGNGAIIDMTGSTIRAFCVTANNITIKNLTIKNVDFEADGGAIYFSSSGAVENCNFINNTASNGEGGAVWIPYGTVENCNFADNHAFYDGGAIHMVSGNVTKCNFANNKAIQIGGGAIYFKGKGTVTNSNFTNNSAPYGGAIRFGSDGRGNISNCNFADNIAFDGDGGAICFSGESILTNCNFANNKATFSYAGAVWFVSGDVTNCNFTNNSAKSSGGAFYFTGNGEIRNCNFANNTVFEDDGGALRIESGIVENCNFTNNVANDYGGAIYFLNTGEVRKCNFTNNKASSRNGGALNMASGIVENCSFTGNTAIKGSAIYFSKSFGAKSISNSIFLNNRANAENESPFQIFRNEDYKIEIIFLGQNNLINAIYSDGTVSFTNVTYWGANGITKISSSSATGSNHEAGQNITLIVIANDTILLNTTKVTDENGTIVLDLGYGSYTVTARHDEDSYYTQAETTRFIGSPWSKLSEEIGHGGNIKLNQKYYTYDFGNTIEITIDNSVIDGNGAIIDLNGSTIRAFTVIANNVTIKNISIINTNIADNNGGAIYFKNNGTVENSNFTNNHGRYVSAIYIDRNAELNISNCRFANNYAETSSTIYFSNGKGTVTNSYFENNTGSKGSGIYFGSGGIAENCTFINNKLNGEYGCWGSAIYFSYEGWVNNCNFINNSGVITIIFANRGGTINNSNFDRNNGIVIEFPSRYEGIVENSNFTNNIGRGYGPVYSAGDATVNNCIFVNNTANSMGGGIATIGKGTVKNSIFINNRVVGSSQCQGGGVRIGGNGIVDSCNFINNTAEGSSDSYGGAIYFGSNGFVNNSNFTNNIVNGTRYVRGGAIYVFSSTAIIENCIFKANQAKNGGAVFFYNYGNITNCKFDSNVGQYGGAIYGIYTSGRGAVIIGSIFNNNSATEAGAIYYAPDYSGPANISITDSNFTNNKASKYGALYVKGELAVVIHCLFINNSASDRAGAIGLVSENATVDYSTFINNTAQSGGAIHVENNADIFNSKFENNRATEKGGAIYASGKSKVINSSFDGNYGEAGIIYALKEGLVENCSFTNNTLIYGGSVTFYECNGTVRNSSFVNNTGHRCGGVYMWYEGLVENSIFIGNKIIGTSSNGAGITFEGKGNVINCNFTGNSAPYTSAIYCTYDGVIDGCNFNNNNGHRSVFFSFEGSQATVINSKFDNNFDVEGAITLNKFGVIDNCIFTNNIARDRGAAISFLRNGRVENSVFINNTINGNNIMYGGAISFLEDGVVNNCNFINNTSPKWGGAIYFSSKGIVYNSNFTDNRIIGTNPEQKGGAIYFSSSVANLENCTFTNNFAETGGAVSFYNDGTIIACTFNNNRAIYGGAVYAEHTGRGWRGAVINQSIFDGNIAEEGSAIYYKGYYGLFIDSNFTNNDATNRGTIFLTKYYNALDGNITSCLFDDNSAHDGGAVYVDGNLISYDNDYANNYAVNGGALYVDDNGLVNLTNDVFKGNFAINGTHNIALGRDARVIMNNVDPEDLGPFKSAVIDVVNITEIIVYGGIINITVNVTWRGEPLEGIVFVTLNQNYTATLENGSATISMPNLNAGLYDVNVTFAGEPIYTKTNKSVQFTVNKKTVQMEVLNLSDIIYGDILTFTVKLDDNKTTGQLHLMIGNNVYYTNITNGSGIFEIPNLNSGNYNGTINNPDANYNSTDKNISFTVNKKTVQMEVVDLSDIVYGDVMTFTVKLDDNKTTGQLHLMIGNNVYYTNITNGSGIFEIPNLNSGNYNGTINYHDANYNSTDKNISFTVEKMNTSITANNAAYIINYGGTYLITLKDAKGNVLAGQKVTFTLNGKNIGSATTNAKGAASIKLTAAALKTANAGNKNLVVKFDGNANYNAATKTAKITINKEKTKIVAKKKTFKRTKKVKKYIVTLKNSKNKAVKKVKVTLKVKGKTYQTKTNKKGKATFKIKNLKKKGTFKATIKFKGNKYYKAATKKVKIKIK